MEEEWIVTLATVDPDDVIYLDLVEEGQRLAQELKQQVISFPFDKFYACFINVAFNH